MRRHRQRRRDGLRCLVIELRETEIDVLIRKGLLKPETRNHTLTSTVHWTMRATLKILSLLEIIGPKLSRVYFFQTGHRSTCRSEPFFDRGHLTEQASNNE